MPYSDEEPNIYPTIVPDREWTEETDEIEENDGKVNDDNEETDESICVVGTWHFSPRFHI